MEDQDGSDASRSYDQGTSEAIKPSAEEFSFAPKEEPARVRLQAVPKESRRNPRIQQQKKQAASSSVGMEQNQQS